jgi:hypothetical protein
MFHTRTILAAVKSVNMKTETIFSFARRDDRFDIGSYAAALNDRLQSKCRRPALTYKARMHGKVA